MSNSRTRDALLEEIKNLGYLCDNKPFIYINQIDNNGKSPLFFAACFWSFRYH